MRDATDAGAGQRDRWQRSRTHPTMTDRLRAANIERKYGLAVDPEEVARDREYQEGLEREPIRRTW